MRQPKIRNHFRIGVRFPSHAYSVTSRNDVELTPQDVLNELEDFARRIRRDLASAAVSPAAGRVTDAGEQATSPASANPEP